MKKLLLLLLMLSLFSCKSKPVLLEYETFEYDGHFYEKFTKGDEICVIHSPNCDCFIRLGYNTESYNGE